MAGQPDLFIPHKTMPQVKQPEYGQDMRQIEMWAKGLKAGTAPSFLQIFAGPDDNANPSTVNWLGSGGNSTGVLTGNDNQSFVPLFSNSTGHDVFYSFGSAWMALINNTLSACFFPMLVAPTFTGGPIEVSLQINAANAAMTQYFLAPNTTALFLTSGASAQFASGNYTGSFHVGTDLSLVAGTGQTGNGIVTSAVASTVYWGGVSGYVKVPTGTTFS